MPVLSILMKPKTLKNTSSKQLLGVLYSYIDT